MTKESSKTDLKRSKNKATKKASKHSINNPAEKKQSLKNSSRIPSPPELPDSIAQKEPSVTKAWWKDGISFQCQGSGKCCTSHGEFGFVYLTPKDRIRMARHLGMTPKAFEKIHCTRTNGFSHLIEDPKNPDCRFLVKKQCSIYEARPTQCRTWPFWPDTLTPKAWKRDVVEFCPGVNKGSKISAQQIKEQLDEQKASEDALDQEARNFILGK